ncbi:MAG: hypothetical protein Q7J28_08225 [Caulobacter sp.]|nr:hypothetical protein [Caulobacter sp.]
MVFHTLKAGVFALLVAMTVSIAPVCAAPSVSASADSSAPAAAAGESAAAPDDMPVTEMAWPTEGDMQMSHDKPKTFLGRLLAWLGMWHPAVIHFPIALVLTVGLLEAAAALRRQPLYGASNKLLLGIATLGAFAAAPLGWASAGMPAVDDESALAIHRWLGTALPFLILALWRLKRPVEQAAGRLGGRGYEAALALTVLLILIQAYFGAEITHGAGHFKF